MSNTTEGPLARLSKQLGLDAEVAPIAAVKRIDVMPVKVGTPVSESTPSEAICPCCTIFEIEPGAELCPRCARVAANRNRQESEKRARLERINREVLALKLDAIDPDWPSKFLTTDAAARFYREELSK